MVDLIKGNWYSLISNLSNERWIFKFDKQSSNNIYVSKCATPEDGYKQTIEGNFHVKNIISITLLLNLDEVYRLFPEELDNIKTYELW